MKFVCLAAAVLILGGCQITTFEKPPIAETACDAGLAGHWSSIGDEHEDDGDVQLDMTQTCSLNVSDLHQGEMRHGEPTQVHIGQMVEHRYLWVDSAWAEKRFESELTPRPGDVYLLRYELKGDELVLYSPDDKLIAHRIIDDEISGDTSKIEYDLHNRITGGPHPLLLDTPGFFKAESIRFRRGPITP